MRLEISTSGYQFRVAGTAKPRPDYKDKTKQATTRDGAADLDGAAGRDRRRA